MRPALAVSGIAAVLLAATSQPALPQTDGTPVPPVEQDLYRGDGPVIIDLAPPSEAPDGSILRPESEAFVQIRGAWAANANACAGVENGNGLYLTDTLVRWEGGTCSVNGIDVEDDAATLYASCVIAGGRTERTFELEVTGKDSMTMAMLTEEGEREVRLERCPDRQ